MSNFKKIKNNVINFDEVIAIRIVKDRCECIEECKCKFLHRLLICFKNNARLAVGRFHDEGEAGSFLHAFYKENLLNVRLL